jgi:hypothetical protein
VRLRHRSCGKLTEAEVVCAHCREPLALADLEMEIGPGFPASKTVRAAFLGRLARSEEEEHPDA